MKTLYLHIGTPKTGTTFLQHFCAENREVLNARGYEYPEPFHQYRYTNPWRNARFLYVRGGDILTLETPEAAENLRQQGYALLEEAFKCFDALVLSDEGLWLETIKNDDTCWHTLMQHATSHAYTVKVIVYLRRQDQFIESMYNQLVKQGTKVKHFKEWLKSPYVTARIDYHENLERIARVVGHDAIDVRIYDRAKLEEKGGIQADFLHAIGLEISDEFALPEGNTNAQSLSGNALAIERLVNISPDYDRSLNLTFKKAAIECTNRSREPRRQLLSSRNAKNLLARCEQSNARIATEYLHSEEPLFDMTLQEDIEVWKRDNPFLYEDTITFFQCVNAEQTKLIEKEGRATRHVPKRSKRTWEEYYASIEFGSAGGAELNVARCLGELFIVRQREIEAGKHVMPLGDDDVADLARVLRAMSRKSAELEAQQAATAQTSSAPPTFAERIEKHIDKH